MTEHDFATLWQVLINKNAPIPACLERYVDWLVLIEYRSTCGAWDYSNAQTLLRWINLDYDGAATEISPFEDDDRLILIEPRDDVIELAQDLLMSIEAGEHLDEEHFEIVRDYAARDLWQRSAPGERVRMLIQSNLLAGLYDETTPPEEILPALHDIVA